MQITNKDLELIFDENSTMSLEMIDNAIAKLGIKEHVEVSTTSEESELIKKYYRMQRLRIRLEAKDDIDIKEFEQQMYNERLKLEQSRSYNNRHGKFTGFCR